MCRLLGKEALALGLTFPLLCFVLWIRTPFPKAKLINPLPPPPIVSQGAKAPIENSYLLTDQPPFIHDIVILL